MATQRLIDYANELDSWLADRNLAINYDPYDGPILYWAVPLRCSMGDDLEINHIGEPGWTAPVESRE